MNNLKFLSEILKKQLIKNTAQKIIVKNNKKKDSDLSFRTIELSIPLDTWSPDYQINNNLIYREKIAQNAFDDEVPIQKQSINSYLDHKIEINNLLASTKDQSMNVYKDNNLIKAEIIVDETNNKLKRTADLISRGVIESNSFIFQPLKIEKNFKKNADQNVMELIYTKAKLISIDPVFEGKYPQAQCCVFDNKTNNYYQIDWNKINEDTSGSKTEEKLLEQKLEKPIKTNGSKFSMNKNQNLEVNNTQTAADNSNQDVILKEARSKKIVDVANTGLLRQKAVDINLIKSKFLKRNKLTNEELGALTDYNLKQVNLANSLEIYKNDVPEFYDGLQTRAIDGTTSEKGLALIQTLISPPILNDWMSVFPELSELANIIPLSGLDEVAKVIFVRGTELVTPIAEGVDTPARTGKTFRTLLKPIRRATKIGQNAQLSFGSNLWEIQTQDSIDEIRRSLRKSFYDNLLKNANTAINTSTYDGGATQEAKIVTTEIGRLSFHDLDKLIKNLEAEFGDNVVAERYVMLMHPNILVELEKLIKAFLTDALIKDVYDTKTKTFRGIKIITSLYYPDSIIVADKKPITFITKDSVTAYGCNILIQDNPYIDMSKDQLARFVKTRGEIKLTDPYVNTRFIQIRKS